MPNIEKDTIYAIATPAGKSAVAIVRVSGTESLPILQKLTGKKTWHSQQLRLAVLSDPKTGEIIDEAMAVYFPSGKSYTGEDCVELHTHGSMAVLRRLLKTLGEHSVFTRLAEAGEFTKRRLHNGAMGLLEAEALADVLEAETEQQLTQALSQYRGYSAAFFAKLRDDLLQARAVLEASLDFADEGLPETLLTQARQTIERLLQTGQQLLQDSARGEAMRHGVPIPIIGPPNVGKSTLLNALARRDVALTSPHAGTTRDVIEVSLNIGGYAVVLQDTAGIREAADPVEQMGIARSAEMVDAASFALVVLDADTVSLASHYQQTYGGQRHLFFLYNKWDLPYTLPPHNPEGIRIDAKTGIGIENILTTLANVLNTTYPVQTNMVLSHARQRECLTDFIAALTQAITVNREELIAEYLRQADAALGRLVGRIDTEEVLGGIFSRFCIGK